MIKKVASLHIIGVVCIYLKPHLCMVVIGYMADVYTLAGHIMQ